LRAEAIDVPEREKRNGYDHDQGYERNQDQA
jgi:hypothetical protein